MPARITNTNSNRMGSGGPAARAVCLNHCASRLRKCPRGVGGWHQAKRPMKWFRGSLALLLAVGIAVPTGLFASSHREAPITALDNKVGLFTTHPLWTPH
jgi:hypothetical protein